MSLRPHQAEQPAAVVLLIAALLACATDSALGQEPPNPRPGTTDRPLVHQYWGIEDGLPLSHVKAVLATRQGYLWLATYDGLVRFDGARFTTFNASNEPDLPTSRFVSIHEDDDGVLWALAEFDHVIRFSDGRFRTYSVPDYARGTAIGGLRFDSEGTVWISTNRGLFWVEEDGLTQATGTESTVVTGRPHVDSDGAVWLANDGRGALRWRDGELESFVDGTTPLGRVGRGFAGAPSRGTYFATGTSVTELRDGSLRELPLPLETPLVWRLITLSGDSALVFTDAGLLVLVDGEISMLHSEVTATGGLAFALLDGNGSGWFAAGGNLYRDGDLVFESTIPIAGLALDQEGSVWVAADGLHRFKPSLFHVLGDDQGAVSNVYPIFEDSRNRVWVGGLSGGVGWFDDEGYQPLLPSVLNLPQAIQEDRDGRILVGLINYGGCLDSEGDCRFDNRFLTGRTIKAIFRDRADSIWIGTDRGVYRESPGDWIHISTDDGLPHNLVRVIKQTADGAMWFGMNGGGIARYRNGEIEGLSSDSGFPSDLVRAIHEVSPGVLLIGTEDTGLLRVALPNPSAPLSEAEVLVLDRSVGIYDDGIHSIVSDGYGRLWMNTNRGIFWILESHLEEFAAGERATIRSIAYGASDGLTNPEGNGGVQSAAIRASDGRLWFAMQAGVAIIDPRDVQGSEHPLPILVEEVRVEGGRSVPAISAANGSIDLDSSERSFEVDYTALGFLAPQNLRFQYRLSDFQPDWIDADDRRTAFFTNVPPGEYRFEVRATREDGVWRELQAPLVLTVQPFFHETLWFRSSLAASVLLLGVAGVRTRERRRLTRERTLETLVSERTATVEAQAAQLEENDRAKSRFFANISHEFRTPLTLTIGPLEDLVSGQHGPLDPKRLAPLQLSLRNSRRLLRLVNQLMEVAKLEARVVEVRARESDLVPFVRELLMAFSPLAEREGIRTRIVVPDHSLPVYFDPDLLERVFLNLLSNAFKFTPEGGTVAIEVAERDEDWVTVSIRDSGPGIAAEQLPHLFNRFYQADQAHDSFQPGTGIGLSLAKELVALHAGRLEVQSDPGFGSMFTAWLPRGSGHLTPEQLVEDTPSRSGVGALVEEELALLETTLRPGDLDHPPGVDLDPEGPPDQDVPTVLIVEDNEEVAAFVRSQLERKFRCLEARDGEAALELTRRQLPDVVVSDVMMPRMNGIELVKALRADRDLAYVPVLLLTAKADQEAKLEGLEAGAAAYLTKPFDSAELVARVDGLIEQQRALRERVRRESLLNTSPPDVETSEDRFLIKLRETIEANLADEDFDVRALARAMSESRSSLYRHIHDMIGETPSQLLKRVRLERAGAMLTAGAGSIQQVAYAVGYKSVSHFSRSFREQYGVPPSRYVEDD